MSTAQEQLQTFNHQVLEHPQLASSYATTGFMNVLLNLNKEMSNNTSGLKDVIRAFTIVLPPVFTTVCKNETESQMWDATEQLIALLRKFWINHTNAGIRIYAFKCVQQLILLESKKEKKEESTKDTFSVNLIRPGHRLMNISRLEADGLQWVDLLLDRLHDKKESAAVITAIVSCLTQLARRRPQFTRNIIGGLVTWSKKKPAHLVAVEIRSIEKCIKLAFITLIKTNRLSPYRSELLGAFTSVGGNPAALPARSSRNGQDRQEDNRRKRTHAPESGAGRGEKKLRTSDHPIPQISSVNQNLGQTIDVSSMPLNVVTDLCIAILQNVSLETLNERFKLLPESMFQQANIFQVPTPATNPMAFSQNQPLIDHSTLSDEQKLTKVPDVDTKMLEPDHVTPIRTPLASAEERASQSLKMQPYNLAEPRPMSQDQQQGLLKMSMQRLLEADYFAHQSKHQYSVKRPHLQNTSLQQSTPRLLTWSATTKAFWALLLSKVFTLGTVITGVLDQIDVKLDQTDDKMPISKHQIEGSESDQLKELLLDFILEDFPNRYDLALAWLHEERYYDIQYNRKYNLLKPTTSLETQRKKAYFDWLVCIVERGIMVLEPKDKTLTKLLLAAPSLNESIITKIQTIMREQTSRFVMCIATLRDLATQRPTVRSQCLTILLNLCTDPDVKTRSTAIAAVKRWVPSHPIAPQVIQHAIDSILILTQPPISSAIKDEGKIINDEDKPKIEKEVNPELKNDEQAQEKEKQIKEQSESISTSWPEQDVVRHTDLFFALCIKKHELLVQLFPVYNQVDQHVQRYIRQHIYNMVTSMGIDSAGLVQSVKSYTPGSETLILRILKILCDTAPPTPALRALIKEIYVGRGLRAKFMLPIITNQVKE